ncbi:kinesin motor domain-containing protein [Cystoisospora suis]|uniref:Kinesin motor domain-containing protein n=1 Tax=Cystoisospora suis TaxID=483139 RepID=A0A2C6L911_9APIC|nr:kinesin motor domain-containing protein [Cystoisospora suis]
MAENIKVVVRIRPPHSFSSLDGLVYRKTGESDSQGRDRVELRGPLTLEETNGGEACAVYIQNRHGNRSEFVFDTVFDSSQQQKHRCRFSQGRSRERAMNGQRSGACPRASYESESSLTLHGAGSRSMEEEEDDEDDGGGREGEVSLWSSSSSSLSPGLECNSQEAVFERTTKPLCDSLLEGFNATILAYGQTGSGKTYTIVGPQQEGISPEYHQERGVLPRALHYLFSKLPPHKHHQHHKAHPTTLENEGGGDLSSSSPMTTHDDSAIPSSRSQNGHDASSSSFSSVPAADSATDSRQAGGDPGIVPDSSIVNWSMEVQFVEIYQEQIFDLLATAGGGGGSSSSNSISHNTLNSSAQSSPSGGVGLGGVSSSSPFPSSAPPSVLHDHSNTTTGGGGNSTPGSGGVYTPSNSFGGGGGSTSISNPPQSALRVRYDSTRRGAYVAGARRLSVGSESKAMQIFSQGVRNRRTAETKLNLASSRSHAVFSLFLHLEKKEEESSRCPPSGVGKRRGCEGGGGLRRKISAQLHFVDLAGSERQKDTQTSGDRLKEAGKINYSLSVLSHVIRELVERGGGGGGGEDNNSSTSSSKNKNGGNNSSHSMSKSLSHIPYRDSKLTFLLMDALGGTSRTTLIATLSPSLQHLSESISTLQFAAMSKRIKNKTTANEVKIWDKASIEEMVRERARQDKEVKRLRALLLQQQSLPGGPLENLSAEGDPEASPERRSCSSSPCSRGEALVGGGGQEEEKLRQKVAVLEEALIQSSELQRKKQLESQQQIDSLEKRIEYYEDFLRNLNHRQLQIFHGGVEHLRHASAPLCRQDNNINHDHKATRHSPLPEGGHALEGGEDEGQPHERKEEREKEKEDRLFLAQQYGQLQAELVQREIEVERLQSVNAHILDQQKPLMSLLILLQKHLKYRENLDKLRQRFEKQHEDGLALLDGTGDSESSGEQRGFVSLRGGGGGEEERNAVARSRGGEDGCGGQNNHDDEDEFYCRQQLLVELLESMVENERGEKKDSMASYSSPFFSFSAEEVSLTRDFRGGGGEGPGLSFQKKMIDQQDGEREVKNSSHMMALSSSDQIMNEVAKNAEPLFSQLEEIEEEGEQEEEEEEDEEMKNERSGGHVSSEKGGEKKTRLPNEDDDDKEEVNNDEKEQNRKRDGTGETCSSVYDGDRDRRHISDQLKQQEKKQSEGEKEEGEEMISCEESTVSSHVKGSHREDDEQSTGFSLISHSPSGHVIDLQGEQQQGQEQTPVMGGVTPTRRSNPLSSSISGREETDESASRERSEEGKSISRDDRLRVNTPLSPSSGDVSSGVSASQKKGATMKKKKKKKPTTGTAKSLISRRLEKESKPKTKAKNIVGKKKSFVSTKGSTPTTCTGDNKKGEILSLSPSSYSSRTSQEDRKESSSRLSPPSPTRKKTTKTNDSSEKSSQVSTEEEKEGEKKTFHDEELWREKLSQLTRAATFLINHVNAKQTERQSSVGGGKELLHDDDVEHTINVFLKGGQVGGMGEKDEETSPERKELPSQLQELTQQLEALPGIVDALLRVSQMKERKEQDNEIKEKGKEEEKDSRLSSSRSSKRSQQAEGGLPSPPSKNSALDAMAIQTAVDDDKKETGDGSGETTEGIPREEKTTSSEAREDSIAKKDEVEGREEDDKHDHQGGRKEQEEERAEGGGGGEGSRVSQSSLVLRSLGVAKMANHEQGGSSENIPTARYFSFSEDNSSEGTPLDSGSPVSYSYVPFESYQLRELYEDEKRAGDALRQQVRWLQRTCRRLENNTEFGSRVFSGGGKSQPSTQEEAFIEVIQEYRGRVVELEAQVDELAKKLEEEKKKRNRVYTRYALEQRARAYQHGHSNRPRNSISSSSSSWGGLAASSHDEEEGRGNADSRQHITKQKVFPSLPFVLPLVAVFDGKQTTRGNYGMVVSKYTAAEGMSDRKGGASSSTTPGLSIVTLGGNNNTEAREPDEAIALEDGRGEGDRRSLGNRTLLRCMPLSQVKKVSRVLEYGKRKKPTAHDNGNSKGDSQDCCSQDAGGGGSDNTKGEQELSFSLYVYRVYFKHPVPVWEESPTEAKTKWVTVAVEEEALRRHNVSTPEACDRLLLSVLKGSAETLKTSS